MRDRISSQTLVAIIPKWPQIALDGLSPAKRDHQHGAFCDHRGEGGHFPQVFAQVWKTLGGDQIP
jgi:hypothetical protein